MKVLVTGGAGFIGANFIQRARAKLTVMQGGQTSKPAGKRDEQKWLN